jgi:two-component system cell cycle sensor histidine kinase PleC
VKFSPEGGHIELLCGLHGTLSELSVVDHGCGIPPETLKEIGKPFVQAEGAYSREHAGTGLGLAICFMLAESMGGSIHIESTVGAGTSVRIRLPRASAAASVVAA